jgi:hypothetical protein
VQGHGHTGHHWLEELNNTTLPGLALLGTLHGKGSFVPLSLSDLTPESDS